MEELKIFENAEFGKVRVVEVDGDPWFVARDIATALGYMKPENAVSIHVNECQQVILRFILFLSLFTVH